MATSQTLTKVTLGAISLLAVYLIFLIPPSSVDLFPQSILAYDAGSYPDGLVLRRHYTGFHLLDRLLAAFGGFFALVADGTDVAIWLFCVWFLPQLCAVLVFSYWEAGRVRNGGFAARPTLVCISAQLLTAGVTLPVYFISHLSNFPAAPNIPLPPNPARKARALLPAVLLGFILPSAALLFPLPSFSLDTIQVISAAWQPFPIYIATALYVIQYMGGDLPNEAYFKHLKRTYVVSGILSAAAHVGVFAYILQTSHPMRSFADIFLPPYWFPITEDSSLPAYRVAARMLFQHDWFTLTLAAFVFFGWTLRVASNSGRKENIGWCILTMLTFGPGVAICWFAVKREEWIWETRARR